MHAFLPERSRSLFLLQRNHRTGEALIASCLHSSLFLVNDLLSEICLKYEPYTHLELKQRAPKRDGRALDFSAWEQLRSQ